MKSGPPRTAIARSSAVSYSTLALCRRPLVSSLTAFSATSRGPGRVTAESGSAVTISEKVGMAVVASTSKLLECGSSARLSARPSGATAHSMYVV